MDVATRDVRRFFVLTYLWSWSLWGLAALSRRDATRFPAAFLHVLGGLGPSLCGALLMQRREPAARRRDFWRRVVDPRRVPLVWYAATLAVTVGPALLTRLAPAGPGGDAELDAAATRLLLVGAPISGMSEELGWRGYALDRLQARHSALGASLRLGVVWSLWHLPLFLIRGTYQHRLGLNSGAARCFFALLVPRSVLFTWVFNNTRRSIFSAVALHAAGNAAVAIAPSGRRPGLRLATEAGLAAAATVGWGAATLMRGGR